MTKNVQSMPHVVFVVKIFNAPVLVSVNISVVTMLMCPHGLRNNYSFIRDDTPGMSVMRDVRPQKWSR